MGQYADIIILLLVVVFIFLRLKSVLGTRPNGESTRLSEESAAKIFDIIIKEAEKNKQKTASTSPQESKDVSNLTEPQKTLAKIPNFEENNFLTGAKRAFEIILTAFSKADLETLEMLVNKTIYNKFKEIIEKRKAEGITSELDFIGFDKAEIVDAKISKNNIAKISVEFVSEQVNLLKDKDGNIMEGDEQYIQTIADTWTFEKSVTSTNPNWILVSTKK